VTLVTSSLPLRRDIPVKVRNISRNPLEGNKLLLFRVSKSAQPVGDILVS
jgi:hypothetical protein